MEYNSKNRKQSQINIPLINPPDITQLVSSTQLALKNLQEQISKEFAVIDKQQSQDAEAAFTNYQQAVEQALSQLMMLKGDLDTTANNIRGMMNSFVQQRNLMRSQGTQSQGGQGMTNNSQGNAQTAPASGTVTTTGNTKMSFNLHKYSQFDGAPIEQENQNPEMFFKSIPELRIFLDNEQFDIEIVQNAFRDKMKGDENLDHVLELLEVYYDFENAQRNPNENPEMAGKAEEEKQALADELWQVIPANMKQSNEVIMVEDKQTKPENSFVSDFEHPFKSHKKTSKEEYLFGKDDEAAVLAFIEDVNAKIQKKAQEDVKKFKKSGNIKQAQMGGLGNVVMWGPEEKRYDAFYHQPVSDWHIIERNKAYNFSFDDVQNVDYETFWRTNIMDKYFAPYRDSKTGRWMGGWMRKRFETDSWIPAETNYQLLPGQLRRPYIPEQRSLEARIATMREKNGDEKANLTDWGKDVYPTAVSNKFNLSKAEKKNEVKVAWSQPRKPKGDILGYSPAKPQTQVAICADGSNPSSNKDGVETCADGSKPQHTGDGYVSVPGGLYPAQAARKEQLRQKVAPTVTTLPTAINLAATTFNLLKQSQAAPETPPAEGDGKGPAIPLQNQATTEELNKKDKKVPVKSDQIKMLQSDPSVNQKEEDEIETDPDSAIDSFDALEG